MFFQFPLSLVRYRAFLDIVMLTFCWNIRKVITICLFNIRNIVIWCVRFFLSGKTLKGTHPQQLKHALICNLDVSLECTNFQMKTIFSIKRFEQLLIWSKLCGESLCLWQSSNIFILNVCWISNTTAARPHYSVFSFHLYSNCGFLALFYIYPAIWCLLPHLTISKHVVHKN